MGFDREDVLAGQELLLTRGLGESEREGGPRTWAELRENRYDPATGVLRFTEGQAAAFEHARESPRAFFSQPSARTGLSPGLVSSPDDLRRLTAFFAWTAWAAAADARGGPGGHPRSARRPAGTRSFSARSNSPCTPSARSAAGTAPSRMSGTDSSRMPVRMGWP